MLTDATNEHAFGMVELIITCALLLTALGMVSAFLLDSWQGAKHAVGTGKAQATANELLTQLGADVRQAMAPGRAAAGVGDTDLRAFVTSGGPASMRDVVVANGTTLWLVSDAVAEPVGAAPVNECVGYVDASGDLTRIVRTYSAGCTGGTELERDLVVRRNGAPASTNPRFRYVLEYNPQVAAGGSINVANCQVTRGVTSVPAASLPRVVAVQVDASAFEGAGAQEFTPESSYSIASRRTSMYRKALGCSY